ncbi:MAG: acyltransferase [Nitrospira sp.]|nr:acyltransferase [Nitrospira sp.]
MALLRPLFCRHGRNFRFDPSGSYSYATITVGHDVFIGKGAVLTSARGITLGSKVMIGPGVMIIGGDHNIEVVGQYMCDVSNKGPKDDLPIEIKDDVWIGAGAIILKGVTIGRGAVVGAGAVVTRDIDPYCIAIGVPAKVLRKRWDEATIRNHEALLTKNKIVNQ